MRHLFAGLLLLPILAITVAAQADSNWVRVAPEGGGFAAMMPSKPDEQTQTKENITSHAYIAKLDRGIYMVSYSDYDPSVKFDAQRELEADRDNFNKVLEATLLTTRNI